MEYAFDDQQCYAPIRGEWGPVRVACACGDDARVVNEDLGINRWVAVNEFRLLAVASVRECGERSSGGGS